MSTNSWVVVAGLVFLACVMFAQQRFASNQFLTKTRDETTGIQRTFQAGHPHPAEAAAISATLEGAASHAWTFGVALWSVPAALCLILFLYVSSLSQRIRRAEKLICDLKK